MIIVYNLFMGRVILQEVFSSRKSKILIFMKVKLIYREITFLSQNFSQEKENK